MNNQIKLLYYDADLCVGCHSCEVACKLEYDLPVGVNRCYILSDGPTLVKGELQLKFKRVACLHCPEPPCAKICPTGAIKKRPDARIFIDICLYNGCQMCAEACPDNAIHFHPYKKWAEICDMCADRLDHGLPPFCVKHCMSGALFFGTKQDFLSRRKRRRAMHSNYLKIVGKTRDEN